MGSPQERQGPLTEKLVEVSLGNGALRIPFLFGRQPVDSDAMRTRLEEFAIAGFRMANPRSKTSDEGILDELSIIAWRPLERAYFISSGLASSNEGFGKYIKPFVSLADTDLRDVFRAIVDPIYDEPDYNPAQIARGALFGREITYADGEERAWNAGELVSHLTIALAERGRVFNTEFDEHGVRIDPFFRWPADLAEMLGIAYLLGEGRFKEDIKGRVIRRMKGNLDRITDLARLSQEEQVKIAAQANELAGAKVLM